MRSRRFADTTASYLFLLPSFAVFAAFTLLPILFSFGISLTSWHILRGAKWSGLRNYLLLLRDADFLLAALNTVKYTIMTVPAYLVVSLLIALLLQPRIAAKGFFRGVFFIPYISPMIVAALVWKWIYHGNYGIIAFLCGLLGLKAPYWLGDMRFALPAVALMSVWKDLGYYLILYLAGLTSVPNHLLEAASIDGAGRWTSFWRVTLPLLRPTVLLVIVMATIRSFQVFGPIYVMTYGGPANATSTIVWLLYQQGFIEYRMGMAAASGFFLFAVVFVTSLVEFRLLEGRQQW